MRGELEEGTEGRGPMGRTPATDILARLCISTGRTLAFALPLGILSDAVDPERVRDAADGDSGCEYNCVTEGPRVESTATVADVDREVDDSVRKGLVREWGRRLRVGSHRS